jgi:hypothetical protein
MATIDITLFDVYGKFFHVTTIESENAQLAVDSSARAAGYVVGFYDDNSYYWNGTAVTPVFTMTPTVTAYQVAKGVTTTIANLPARAQGIVTPPVEEGLDPYVIIDPIDDGQIVFSANVDGIYDIELDAPKFADYNLQIQVGNAVFEPLPLTQYEVPLALTVRLLPISVSVKSFTETTLSATINANTNIQPSLYSFTQTLPELNINDMTTVQMATKAILQTFLSCSVDDVIQVPVSLKTFTQTTLSAVINAQYYIQLDDSMYVPVRVYEVNVASNDYVSVDLFAFTETSPFHTVA